MGSERGASMPSRTVEPEMSITATITSSPSTIRSPTLRVISSIGGRSRGLRRVAGRAEQLCPELGAGRLVDDLVRDPGVDQDRRLEVGGALVRGIARADRHVHVDGGDVVEAEPVGLLVGDLDLEG